MKRTLVAAGVAIALPLTVAAPAHAASIEIEAEGPVIELSIYESIDAEPDIVEIGAGVSTNASTAVEAMRLNAADMQRVVARIKALGVAERDIQTSGISLNPRYEYNRTTEQNVFVGYQASNRVNVKLRKIEETGEVLDALVVAGATDLSGPSFSLDDDTAAKATASKRAIERANARAAEYASMLGHDGYKVLEINEFDHQSGGRYRWHRDAYCRYPVNISTKIAGSAGTGQHWYFVDDKIRTGRRCRGKRELGQSANCMPPRYWPERLGAAAFTACSTH